MIQKQRLGSCYGLCYWPHTSTRVPRRAEGLTYCSRHYTASTGAQELRDITSSSCLALKWTVAGKKGKKSEKRKKRLILLLANIWPPGYTHLSFVLPWELAFAEWNKQALLHCVAFCSDTQASLRIKDIYRAIHMTLKLSTFAFSLFNLLVCICCLKCTERGCAADSYVESLLCVKTHYLCAF